MKKCSKSMLRRKRDFAGSGSFSLARMTTALDKVYSEIALLHRLDHPGVCRLLRVIDDPDQVRGGGTGTRCEERGLASQTHRFGRATRFDCSSGRETSQFPNFRGVLVAFSHARLALHPPLLRPSALSRTRSI